MRRGFSRIFSVLLLGGLLAISGCGDVTWFVSFHAGSFDETRQEGLVVIIGQAHPEPLQEVRLLEGELPPGMALQEDGTVRGIPEAGGVYDFTLELTEMGGKVLRKSYSVELEAGDPGS
ncbi:MAG: hypothetical protein IT573_00290 [Deltaproteobacteria bacterium]|nr:hypothetical protein [Deltaproteobacteria bacterium]